MTSSNPCVSQPPASDGPRGTLVTFEGIDGVGKTTQCTLLCEALEARGAHVVRLREPGATHVGEQVRGILLSDDGRGMDPRCELLLFEAARAQLVETLVVPALEEGAVVVLDRFFDSTEAYQGHGRGLPLEAIAQANALACGGLRPDRTILLDMEPHDVAARMQERTPDRIELAGADFQARVREGFLAIAAREPDRVRRVDAGREPEAVWRDVRAALEDLLDLGDAGASPR